MQHLPLPITAIKDEAVVVKLAKAPAWTPHESTWLAAYRAYHANSGSPFALSPHNFGPGIDDLQYELYDTRKNSGDLRRMRRQAGLKSCPVCGSPVTGDLDHYLPRKKYPEFSIMRANLVPACTHCNSGAKGKKVHGGAPRRFIHPYFDQWAKQAIWYVEVAPPYKAATFKPRPIPTLPPPHDQIVSFHLENVLGNQFYLSMANEWSSLPAQIRLRDQQLTVATVTKQVKLELEVAQVSKGINSWQAALLRGILQNPGAISHLIFNAASSPQPP